MTSTASPAVPRKAKQRVGDRVFSGSTLTAGSLILAVLAAVAGFLIIQGMPGVVADPETTSILRGESFWAYVWPLVFGTLWAATIALVIAIPLSIGIALFISHYAPRGLATVLGYIVDLLAAVPSVVFGLWGANTLAPATRGAYTWLEQNLGWIPLFEGPGIRNRALHSHRGNRARRHGAAHHHRHLP